MQGYVLFCMDDCLLTTGWLADWLDNSWMLDKITHYSLTTCYKWMIFLDW